MIAKDGNQNSK